MPHRHRWLRSRAAALLGLAGLACALGCGSVTASPQDAAAEASPVTIADGCNQVAKAQCDALDGCAPFYLQVLFGDESTCVMRVALSCMTDQSVDGTTRTAADLVTCAKGVAATGCGDLVAGHLPAACAVKPGTVVNGMACGSDWQCQSTYCNKTDACGVCSPRHAANGDCTVDAGCATGLVCANQKCVAPAGVDGACNLPGQPCSANLYCTSSTGGGKCVGKLMAGEVCADNPKDACDFVNGDVCNTLAIPNTCVTISVATGGEACGLSSKTACVGGLAPCSNLLVGGVCANPAPDGEACGDNAVCVPPATCVGKVCRLPSAPDCH